MLQDETDKYIKDTWEEFFYIECAHLKKATEMLEKYEGKKAKDVLPSLEFPKLLSFKGNKEYIRKVLKTVGITSVKEKYVPARELPRDARFFKHLDTINGSPENVASHVVICKHIAKYGKDYRYEDEKHPIEELQNRKKDNIEQGRV